MSEAAKILHAARDADREIHTGGPSGAASQPAGASGPTLDPTLDPGAEWGLVVSPLGPLASVFFPEVRDAYSGPVWRESCAQWGGAMHNLCQHYGWSIGKAGPIIGIVAATANLAAPALVAMMTRRAARQAKEPQSIDNAPAAVEVSANDDGE